MTPPAAPDTATDRQTVGDILLARGYIKPDQLQQAIGSQQQSGKPLGQVLVEAGAITRLELASALAEQWSDTATWLGPPEESHGRAERRARQVPDDPVSLEGQEAGYAQQLQDAVVELGRRFAAFEPQLTDLKIRLEAAEVGGPEKLLDRIEVVQDGLTGLARRLDELTDGIERAFTSVELTSGELAAEVDVLTSKLELTADRSAVDDIRGTLHELTARPAADPVLASQLDELAAQLEELREAGSRHTDSGAVAELRADLDELAADVARAAGPAALDELRSMVVELAERSRNVPALDARLDELAARLDELADRPEGDPAVAVRLEELTGRIEALAGTDALETVRHAVEELAGRTAGDPALTARIDELAARLDETTDAIAARADAAALEELRAAVTLLTDRPETDGALTARIDELGVHLNEVVETLGTRVEHGALAPLHQAIDELTTRVASFADADALVSIRATLDEVVARPAIEPALLEQVSELAARVEQLAAAPPAVALDDEALAALRSRIDDVAGRSTDDPELERRIDHVVGRLDALHGRVEEVAATLDSRADHAALDDLRAELKSLGERPTGDPELTATIDAVAARVAELAAAVARTEDQVTKDDIAAVRAELDSVAMNLTVLDDLAGRLQRVEETAVPASDGPAADLAETLRSELESRIEAIASRTDGLAQETAGAVGALESERAALAARIDALAAELAESRVQVPAATPPPAEPSPAKPGTAKAKTKSADDADPAVESELERLRMAVERINLHLGERERAIAELIRSRTSDVKVEELAARLADLEQGGAAPTSTSSAGNGNGAPALGGNADMHSELRELAARLESAEAAAKADRDKVLTQLERMASSIDWRVRRLESGETDAAA